MTGYQADEGGRELRGSYRRRFIKEATRNAKNGPFQGGVVLVSHDERLIELVCKELWVVKDAGVRRLDGGLAEYRAIIEEELAAQR